MNKKRFITIALAFVMFFTIATGIGYVSANGTRIWAEWTGQTEIAEVTEIATQMVIQINELENEAIDLTAQIVGLNADIVILEDEIAVLETNAGNDAATIAQLQLALQEMTALKEQLQVDLMQCSDARYVLMTQLQTMTEERDWLQAELNEANADMIQFKEGICEEVDSIRNDNKRAQFDEWCGVRP